MIQLSQNQLIPWVVGVENLYTPYFYELARTRLTKDGLFVQWMHTYSMSPKILTTILSNLKKTFKNITILRTGRGDIAFFSSNRTDPFRIDARHVIPPHLRKPTGTSSSIVSDSTTSEVASNLEPEVSPPAIEPMVRTVLDRLRVERVSDLNFYEAYNSLEVDAIVASQTAFTHEIFYPKLNQEAYTHFYSGSRGLPRELIVSNLPKTVKRPRKELLAKEPTRRDCERS